VNGLAEAFWLAKKELKRAWLSYVLSVLFFVFLGLCAVPGVSGVFELEGFGPGGRRMEAFYNAFFADYLFLLAWAFLGGSAISRDYTLSSRLLFLRRLPIPAGSLVGSRALCMLVALVPGAPAFFLPAFFLTDLGEIGVPYLWFAGVWIGYCLFASGVCLHLRLTVNCRGYSLISFGFAASIMVVLALLEWRLDLSLVGRTAELAQSGYGALPAILSVLAGGAAFALLSRMTVRRVEKRDLSP
jgi:hypothetical protein